MFTSAQEQFECNMRLILDAPWAREDWLTEDDFRAWERKDLGDYTFEYVKFLVDPVIAYRCARRIASRRKRQSVAVIE